MARRSLPAQRAMPNLPRRTMPELPGPESHADALQATLDRIAARFATLTPEQRQAHNHALHDVFRLAEQTEARLAGLVSAIAEREA
jgi:hypothetical protein